MNDTAQPAPGIPGGANPPDETEDTLQVRLSELRETLAHADLTVRTFVRDHPVMSVAGAVATGYLAGRLFRRR